MKAFLHRYKFEILLLLITFLVYANAFPNTFVYDDEFFLLRNRFIRDPSLFLEMITSPTGAGTYTVDNLYRPLQMILYFLIYQCFGLNEIPYHFLNILLHGSNGIFLFSIFRKLNFSNFVSFSSALLFVVHPIHTEAVTYMNGTADPLGAFFGIGSIYLYLDNRKVLSFIWQIFALFSKETMVIIPGLIFAIEVFRSSINKNLLKILPYALLSLTYFILRLTVLNFENSLSFHGNSEFYAQNLSIRLITFLATLPQYYSLLIFPIHLTFDRVEVIYDSIFHSVILFSFFLHLCFLFLAYISWKKKKIFLLCLLWFFIAMIPVSGIIPINGIIKEHWLYLPSVAFFLLFAKTLEDFVKSNLKYLFIAIPTILFSIRTYARNLDWKNPISLYTSILKYNPSVARVRNNLAMAYADQGNLELAEQQYKEGLQYNPTYPEIWYNLGNLYLTEKKYNEANACAHQALKLNPKFFHSYILLSKIALETNKIEEAKVFENKATELIQQFSGSPLKN